MGDLVLVINNDTVKSGIDRSAITVMDVDDKITCLSEIDNQKNKLAVILRTMKNLIGEYSNYASAYHNKTPKTEEQRKLYENYVSIIAVCTGKSIDFSKTGVLFPMPRNISKYGRPLPYFMGYRDQYYKRQKLSKAYSNMNRLCYKIEKWERQFRWKRTYSDFDYNIMIDNTIETDEFIYSQIEQLFIEFHREMAQLAKEQREIRLEYKDFVLNWSYYYGQYKKKCNLISKDKKMIANIAVHLSYVKYPNKNKKFMWCIASEGILQNLEQQPVLLPAKCENGKLTYLGKKYILVKEGKGDIQID